MATAKDVIVTVHGTFASAESDTGNAWWQKGSDFTEELKRYWPTNRTPPEIHPYSKPHWTGENTYAARNAAANELRKQLTELLPEERIYLFAGRATQAIILDPICPLAGKRHMAVFSNSPLVRGTSFLKSGKSPRRVCGR